MRNIIVYGIFFVLLSCSSGDKENSNLLEYPSTKTIPFVETIHGTEISDPYRWLEDFTSDEAKIWVDQQNAFTKKFIIESPAKNSIREDLSKIWVSDSISTPFKRKDKTFYYFNDGNWQQSKLMMKACEDCDEEVLIDPNLFSKDGTVSLGNISISPNAKFIAYSISDGGSDWRSWKVMEIDSKKQLDDNISWSKFSGAVWENDNSGFYYQKYDEPRGEALLEVNEAPQLYFHVLGTKQTEDKLIYENPDKPRWGYGINVVKDSSYKILSISEGTDERNRVYIKLDSKSDFIPIIDELKGAYSFISANENILWFYTTDNAPNGKVVKLEINEDESMEWSDVIKEDTKSIRSVNVINNSFAIVYLEDTLSSVNFYDLDGQFSNKLSGDFKGSIGGFGGSIEDTETYFSFTNFTTPSQIYKFDLAQNASELFWEEKLPDFNSNDYKSELRFFKSKDGTKIPLHVSFKKDTELNSKTPILLYGYGGFNISILPRFSKSYLAWMNQGGVVAVANLRGGGEYGEAWHADGMLFNKQNVFDDFAYAAKYLHKSQIGSPSSTAIQGGSNGGLLVAATMLQNPSLFAAAIPQVGVLDMLRFNKFTIGWAWESDYGSPEKRDEFYNLLAYSPYHNIENGECYPPTLITTSERDDRVVPSHSYKFAARLQASQGCNDPILIRIEGRAGHGAGTPKSKRIEQISDVYGFALASMK
jgi:prolyl oligopeptidase